MREAVFIKQNKEKWESFEQESDQSPDEVSERFVQLTDDLSFARTFYPNSSVTNYLNGLTTKFYGKIYANKREKQARFWLFWKQELPLLFFQVRPQLRLSLGIFLFFSVLGAYSAHQDETFVRLILGDSYVNTTLENIERGDPLAIYSSSDSFSMFFQITLNNILVSFMTFLGFMFSVPVPGSFVSVPVVIPGVGTAFSLFRNGIMLGSFQYFFFQKGLLLTSILKIWIHGTLEISAIVIAGAAGFVAGQGVFFPQTYARLVAIQYSFKRGLKVALGLVPVFVMAGFLESFVTRLSLHPAVSCLIIGTSAAFILWYFWWYPRRVFEAQKTI
jgi:uncharacterized membrane protein SpoIIM required for sporulation